MFTEKTQLNSGDNLVNIQVAKQLIRDQIYVLTINGATKRLAAKFIISNQ